MYIRYIEMYIRYIEMYIRYIEMYIRYIEMYIRYIPLMYLWLLSVKLMTSICLEYIPCTNNWFTNTESKNEEIRIMSDKFDSAYIQRSII